MKTWRVLVVEDDSTVRDFFAASVRRCSRLELVDAVGTLEAACKFLRRDPWIDVLLTDLGLPDGDGLEIIRMATRLNPRCEPLVISMFGDEEHVLASIEAGALGYIHKDCTPEDIAQVILEMKAGASPISPMIARKLLARYAVLRTKSQTSAQAQSSGAGSTIQSQQPVGGVRPLTAREQDVLSLIARGFSYAEVARLLSVSVHTVQAHIKSLYAKLAVHSKNEAVFEATRLGLL